MSNATKPVPAAVTELVDAILRQSNAGEHFRPDFTKYAQACFEAGQESNHVKVNAPPLEPGEIEILRGLLRKMLPTPAKAE